MSKTPAGNVFHQILDRTRLLESLDPMRAEILRHEEECSATGLKIKAVRNRMADAWHEIEVLERAIKATIVAEAAKLGQVPQSIVLTGHKTAFMIETDGDLVEYQQVNAIQCPTQPAGTAFVAVTEDDGELDFEFSPDDRIGLTPIPPEVEAELAGLRVDGLSDDELSEAAAFEAIHDLIGLEAAEAWRAKGSPMRPGAKPGAVSAIESVGQPLNGHPMAAHAVADMVDSDGYVPASALAAMREAAAAQAFGSRSNVIG